MFNINKKLTKWADAGLISESQKQNILKYQDSQNSSPWVLYGFGLLGAVAIGIGLISVISANWNFIPSYIKLSVNWILLLATACGAYYSYSKNKPLLFEVLLTFLFIQTIASIGLIAQVYNLNGSTLNTILVWLGLTCGIFFISKKVLNPFLWAVSFFAVLLSKTILDWLPNNPFSEHYLLVFTCLLLVFGIFSLLLRYKNTFKTQMLALTYVATLGVIKLIIGYESIASGMRHSYKPIVFNGLSVSYFIPLYIFAIIFGMLVLKLKSLNKTQKVLSILSMVLLFTPLHFALFNISESWIYAIFYTLFLSCISIIFASLGFKKIFHILLVIIGIRFLIFYFQAFGGLATTGIGLILSGGIILIAVYFWNKYKEKLQDLAQKVGE